MNNPGYIIMFIGLILMLMLFDDGPIDDQVEPTTSTEEASQ